jgi:uncharacterized SAM-binding protein YcdF (DUF218 family)
VQVVIEDQSTNCGANATETRKALEREGVNIAGEQCIIVQDPTMSLRTLKSFEKAYEDVECSPVFSCCPEFVPRVKRGQDGELVLLRDKIRGQLWDIERYLELILGEVPRLRDDESGYGPRGKGFIGHVDIPDEVEEAWGRLESALGRKR